MLKPLDTKTKLIHYLLRSDTKTDPLSIAVRIGYFDINVTLVRCNDQLAIEYYLAKQSCIVQVLEVINYNFTILDLDVILCYILQFWT